MAKTIKEMAEEYAATGEFLENGKELIDFQAEKAYMKGANAVLEATKEELMRAYMNDFNMFSEHDREIAQGVLGVIQMFLNELKGE